MTILEFAIAKYRELGDDYLGIALSAQRYELFMMQVSHSEHVLSVTIGGTFLLFGMPVYKSYNLIPGQIIILQQ